MVDDALRDGVPSPWTPPAPVRTGPDASLLEIWRTSKDDILNLVPARAYRDDYCRVRIGPQRVFMPLSVEGVSHVMIRAAADYPKDEIHSRILGPLTGNGLLLSEGTTWRAQRRAIGHAFTPRAAGDIAPIAAGFIDRAIDAGVVPCDKPIDLHAWVDRLAFALTVETLLPMTRQGGGKSLIALQAELREKVQGDLWDAVAPAGLPVPRGPGRRQLSRRLDSFIIALLAESGAQSATAPGGGLLAQFSSAFGAAKDRHVPGGLHDQLKTFLIAGSHTLTDTLYPALAVLAQNKAVQSWLRASVAETDLAPTAIAAHWPRLENIIAFLREVLRLAPPIAFLWRRSRRDDVIDGQAVKAGTLILISPWALHRHGKHWRDPHAFDPRRFLPGAPEPHRAIYMPFGAGPRICIGQHMAMAEAVVILAKLVARFEIAPAENQANPSFPPKRSHAFCFRPRQRQPAGAVHRPQREAASV